jgi:hypothetical protein
MMHLRLCEQLLHESQEFPSPAFDSSRSFAISLPPVKQPPSEKTKTASDDAAKNHQTSFPNFIRRHALFFEVCFLIGLVLGYFLP